MATNADEKPVADDDKPVTEDDLRDLKYGEDGVETTKVEDEPAEPAEEEEPTKETESEEDGQTEDQAKDGEEETPPAEFVKEFPYIKGDTPEEYAKNLEIAYQNSTSEALRLKNLAEETRSSAEADETEDDGIPVDPRLLYVDKLLDRDIQKSYAEFKKSYPQTDDPTEYTKFQNEVASLNNYYVSKKQILTADEVYLKAAVILGWQPEQAPDSKDKLNVALKNSAASSKTTSATKQASKSKVTDAMVSASKRMYPNKTDVEIRKELEPYVQ